ncbi:lipase 1-like [Aphomia sociella]
MYLFPLLIIFEFINYIIINVSGEKCTSFNDNIHDIPNELKDIDVQFGNVIQDFIDTNILAIDSIYKEYQKAENNEDIHLNLTQLINKYNYPVEEHEVETSDGYLLKMFRIPNDGPVMLLTHGLFSSSDDFFTIGSNNGLGYLLADSGYDVWISNARGNKYSRRHVRLSPSCAEFWDFSWDEIGRYDLPATIDHILNKTNEKDLVYIGHSQGSTSYFVLCSELPEYNDKIRLMIAFSAVAFFPRDLPVFPSLYYLLKAIHLPELAPRNALTQYLTDTFCGTPALATVVCANIAGIFNGINFNFAQINATALPVIYGHTPSGSATKQYLHYVQLIKSGKFAKYDYGSENLVKYYWVTPPDYPIENIRAPMAIYYSVNDKFTPVESVKKFISKLKIVPKLIKVPDDKFTHLDFIFARDVKKLLYDNVLELIYQTF